MEPGRRLIGSVGTVEVEIAFTGVPVTTLAAGRDFFERLFGRPADVEVAVDEVMWRLAESAWLYVVVDAARAGRGLVAFSVADLDATLAELEHRDIRPDRIEEVGGGRKAVVLDPDGNTVAVISVPT
jgi:glyoxylase I family protein